MAVPKSRVIFSAGAYNTILAETLHMDPKETGGIFLGHCEEGIWYVLECIEPGPGSVFKDYYFEYDHGFVNYLARARARRYEVPLQVLGLWHRHPLSMDTFSTTDDGTNLAFARLSSRGAISALVNLDPDFRLTVYRFGEKLDYEQIPFTVSDADVPPKYLRKKYQDRIPEMPNSSPQPSSNASLREKFERIARPGDAVAKITVYAPAELSSSRDDLLLFGYYGEQPHFYNVTDFCPAPGPVPDRPKGSLPGDAHSFLGYFLGLDTIQELDCQGITLSVEWMDQNTAPLMDILKRQFPSGPEHWGEGLVLGFGDKEAVTFYFIDGGRITKASTEPYTLSLDVFSRNAGILETDMMKGMGAVISGCGSVGSYAALELARSGVGRFLLVDHDVLSYANICRHQCGIADVGRFKVDAVADRIRQINPEAEIVAVHSLLENVPAKEFDRFCGPDALMIGCADNREGDIYAAKISAHHKMPMVSIGFWERAFAGEVFYYLPDRADLACYSCFVSALGELSGRESVNRRLYTSQDDLAKVNFMPGISVDITFVTNIGVKLSLDILNRNNPRYIPRLLDSLTQFTLIANTDKPEIGGAQASVFSYPLQVTTSIVVDKVPGCRICGKTQ